MLMSGERVGEFFVERSSESSGARDDAHCPPFLPYILLSEPTSPSTTSTAAAASPTTAPPTTAFGAAAATQIADARDYDWTYSTTWAGESGVSTSSSSTSPPPSSEIPSFTPGKDPAVDRIPVERLGASSGEPILFYDDLVLFEDELGDNGSSMLGVKVVSRQKRKRAFVRRNVSVSPCRRLTLSASHVSIPSASDALWLPRPATLPAPRRRRRLPPLRHKDVLCL